MPVDKDRLYDKVRKVVRHLGCRWALVLLRFSDHDLSLLPLCTKNQPGGAKNLKNLNLSEPYKVLPVAHEESIPAILDQQSDIPTSSKLWKWQWDDIRRNCAR